MDGVVEAASAQKSFIALLFIAVTEFLCFLYLDQFKSVGTQRNCNTQPKTQTLSGFGKKMIH